MNKQKNHIKEQAGLNPVAIAVTGAIVGAGVAIAGVAALNDKQNREKIKDAFVNIKDHATGYIENAEKETEYNTPH